MTTGVPKAYIICTTPRSGSTLLCRLLAATGRTGNPDSFYHRREFMREFAAEWGLPNPDTMPQRAFDVAYLEAALKAGRAGTGVFGLRLQREYVKLLSDTLDRLYPGLASEPERFARAFGEIVYIHLTRTDKVAQAVSLVKAQQSGLWHLNADGSVYERLGEPREPQYDFGAIHAEVVALERDDGDWAAWFDRHGIRSLRIGYEDFAANPAATLIEICAALGVRPPDADAIKPGLSRLSDAVSLDWIRRYRVDRIALGDSAIPAG